MCTCYFIVFSTSESLWAKHRIWRPFPSLPEIWMLGWGFCNDRLLRLQFSAASGDELREDLLWDWRLRLLNLNQIPPFSPTPCLTLLPFILLLWYFPSIQFLIVLLVQCVVLLGVRSFFLFYLRRIAHAHIRNTIHDEGVPDLNRLQYTSWFFLNLVFYFCQHFLSGWVFQRKKLMFEHLCHQAWPLF